jgi:hypothetical protein
MLNDFLTTATHPLQVGRHGHRRQPREGETQLYDVLAHHQGSQDGSAKPTKRETKGAVLWLLGLVAPVLWIFLPLILLALAEVAFAQQGGSRALVQDPTGLLAGNQKAKDAVALLNWILLIAGAVPATVFTVYAGKKFNDQEYGAALGSALGAVIAGLGGYIAFSFM